MPLDRRRRALAAALVLLVTVVAMEAMAVITILPVVKRDLGGLAWYGWVVAGFALAQIAAIPATGRLLDRTNPAVPLVIGISAFGAGLFAGALAPNMPVLVAGRILQGLGAGVIPAVAYFCVGRGFEEEQRPRVFALMSTAWIVPSIASPAGASLVAHYFGWRWVFGGLIPVTALAGGLAVPAVRALGRPPAAASTDGEPTDQAPSTVGPSLVLTIGAAAMIAGFGLHQPALAVVVGIAGIVVTGFAFRRLTPPGTLTARAGLPAAVLLRGLLTFSFFATDAYVSLTLETVRHTGTVYSGVVYAAASFTWTAGSWIQARVSTTHGARIIMRAGFVITALGAGLMAVVVGTSVPTWMAIIAWAVGGLGIGLAYAQPALVVLSAAEPGRQGFSTAALQLSDVLGVAVGTGIGGVIVTTSDRWGHGITPGLSVVFWGSVVVAAIGFVLSQRLPSVPTAKPTEPDAAEEMVLEESIGRQGI